MNKNELEHEIEKLATEFNWIPISSSENHFEFKVKASSFRSSNTFSLGREYKRYIDIIIQIYSGKF